MIEEMKKEFEDKFVRSEGNPDQDNYGERYIDEEPYKLWQWFESKLKSEIDEERNIGARLMAERILNELKNPSDGKFGCDTANDIIDYFKSEIAEACKKQRVNAIDMVNILCRIAIRYNTVVSSEAVSMEFKEVFDKYFPPLDEVK